MSERAKAEEWGLIKVEVIHETVEYRWMRFRACCPKLYRGLARYRTERFRSGLLNRRDSHKVIAWKSSWLRLCRMSERRLEVIHETVLVQVRTGGNARLPIFVAFLVY